MTIFSYFLYAFCVVACVHGDLSALVGPRECLDSVYWCKNFTTATQCNAVNHCIQTVWETQASQHSYKTSCSTCQGEIEYIRETINSNTTKEVVEDLLDNICDLTIITRVVRKTCEKYVNLYVDNNLNELLDLIHSEVDPQTICHLLGFCFTVSIEPTIYDDEATVRFDNVELHFPASYLHLEESKDLLLGSSKCTWGPSYWCSNITASKECKSTSHCIESVWQKTTYEEDTDSVCQVCKDMVKQARDQLQSNETQEELREVFEGSCKLIHLKPVVAECVKLADEFVPELTEMLVSQMNPTAVCTVAGLCNSPRIDEMLLQSSSAENNVILDSCANCSVAFAGVGEYLKRTPKNEVLNRLLGVCGQFSSFSDACSTILIANFDNLYAKLLKMEPWAACHLTGMCVSRYHFHPNEYNETLLEAAQTALAAKSDDLPCDLCKQLVNHLKEVLITNTTEEEFQQILKGICKQTGKFENDCLKLVEDDFKLIYDFLTKELDPQAFCTEVNLCPKSKNSITDVNLSLITSRTYLLTQESTSVVSDTSSSVTGPLECRACKTVVQLLQRELDDPAVEHDIENVVKKVCYLASAAEKNECNQFIDKYSAVVINLLSQGTDPAILCSLMDLCPNEKPAAKYEFCPFCQDITKYLQQVLEDPKTEDEIKAAVEKVCDIVPQEKVNQCKEFIAQYSSLIVSVLAEEADPTLVCPALKLCPGLTSSANRCDYCTRSMNTFISHLKGRNKDQIVKKLDSFVAMSPKEMAPVTVELKVHYFDDIVDMMMAEFNGEESCTYLRFCEPRSIVHKVELTTGNVETNEILSTSVGGQHLAKVGAPNCEICEMFVKLYENKLTSNATEQQLEAWLNSYCNHITEPELKSNCTVLVDKYVPQFIALLKKDVTPKELCQLVKICPARFEPRSMETCRGCEAVIGSIQGLLRDPYVSNDLVQQLDKVCSLVGGKNQGLCEEIVSVVGPELDGIVFGIPSWYYCSKVKMCPYRADLIQNEDCRRGEAFWCQNESTAIVCDKLEHCQSKVWKSEKPSL